MSEHEALTAELAAAIRNAQPFPAFPAGLSLADAYAVQAAVVAELCDAPAGLKAGATAPAAMAQFGLDAPVMGRLYPNGRLADGATITSRPGLVIECEVGIVVDASGAARSAGAALEFVAMAFADPADVTGVNLVSSNVAAFAFLPGEPHAWRDDYGALQVRLTRDGELLNEAPLDASLGGPAPALAWMNEEAAARGMPVADNMLFMTGACGKPVPGLPGRYEADYGPLGKLSFEIEAA